MLRVKEWDQKPYIVSGWVLFGLGCGAARINVIAARNMISFPDEIDAEKRTGWSHYGGQCGRCLENRTFG